MYQKSLTPERSPLHFALALALCVLSGCDKKANEAAPPKTSIERLVEESKAQRDARHTTKNNAAYLRQSEHLEPIWTEEHDELAWLAAKDYKSRWGADNCPDLAALPNPRDEFEEHELSPKREAATRNCDGRLQDKLRALPKFMLIQATADIPEFKFDKCPSCPIKDGFSVQTKETKYDWQADIVSIGAIVASDADGEHFRSYPAWRVGGGISVRYDALELWVPMVADAGKALRRDWETKALDHLTVSVLVEIDHEAMATGDTPNAWAIGYAFDGYDWRPTQ